MNGCLHCCHWDYQHSDIRLGAPCLVTYGLLGDSAFIELGDDERCRCRGFEPGGND